MKIRRWEKRDNAVIEEIERVSFSDPWSMDMLDSCFLSDGFYGLVAEDDDKIAGYVGAVYLFETADIVNVCVAPDFRRKGVAETLLIRLIDYLKENGVENVYLEVRKSNLPAVALYEKLGFKKFGERKKYYEDSEDAIVYRKDI